MARGSQMQVGEDAVSSVLGEQGWGVWGGGVRVAGERSMS